MQSELGLGLRGWSVELTHVQVPVRVRWPVEKHKVVALVVRPLKETPGDGPVSWRQGR